VEDAGFCLRDHQGPPAGLLAWWWTAFARVPFTRDTGMEWTCRLPAANGRLVSWLGHTPRVLETRSRITALHGDADRLSAVEMKIELSRDGREAGTIDALFALFHGITRLHAKTPRGEWQIEETPESESEPTA
jgi:hypothetical protein